VTSVGIAAALGAVAIGAAAVPSGPPLRPGPWRKVGATLSSGTHSRLVLRRGVLTPTAIAFVVTAPAGKKVRVQWSNYCQAESDDDDGSAQGTIAGTTPLVAYPTVFTGTANTGAQICYVWVRATSSSAQHLTATIYAY
jgi:hypothetical protein